MTTTVESWVSDIQRRNRGEVEVIDSRSGDTERMEAEKNFRVGSIWYTSWGYDQTNVEFFQVVRESKASVWVRAIAGRIEGGRLHPVKDFFISDFQLKDKAKLCRKQGYGANGTYTVLIRISGVRTAWPYEGRDGVYDTYAAGGMGH